MDHFDEMTALLYMEEELGAERVRDVGAHARECQACRNLLESVHKEGAWLKDSLETDCEPIPAKFTEWQVRKTAPWGSIAAVVIAATGMYTLWSDFVDPWLDQAAQAGFTQGNLLMGMFFASAFWRGWDTVQTSMEIVAITITGVILIWLLRSRLRRQLPRFTMTAVVMGALVCAIVLPSASQGAEVKHGDPNFTLSAGEEVNTDLVVAAQRTRIDGDVDGDLIVFSRSITVNGHVKGDVIAFGQEVRVSGPVDGNVRAFTQSLTLNGEVGKNVMAWAQEIEMDEKASVGGTMTIGSSNTQMDGRVGGDLLALVGVLDINGTLGHDAMIRAERLSIGQNAQISGHVKYSGRRQPQVSSGAKLAGPIEITTEPRRGPDYSRARYYWRQFLLWGAGLVFGIALILLAPRFVSEVNEASAKAASAIGLGLLFLFAIPIAAVIALITIVGFSVGVAAVLLYLIALYAAQIFIGEWLGQKLLGSAAEPGPMIARLALGLAILRVLRMIPFLGPLVGLVMTIWGFGALILAFYKRMRPGIALAA